VHGRVCIGGVHGTAYDPAPLPKDMRIRNAECSDARNARSSARAEVERDRPTLNAGRAEEDANGPVM
jgi:hypothetical protein